ncbi:N2,N2-dimethylguanosine tRNA methyltransferase [Suillus decipiens]|nr:N2,N2-dimethylguanosine tRNA methyltransferase [Suillus decipiens]
MSDGGSSSITVPEGFALHTENTSHILISSKEEAFLNPVQEFNRDLSVACIRVWSEELNREKEAKWKQSQERRVKRKALAGGEVKTGQQKKAKTESTEPSNGLEDDLPGDIPVTESTSEGSKREYRPHKFVLLEALSATGLRSIRYAKEIPLVRFVIANDLSASATAAMKRNVELNGLGPSSPDPADSASSSVVSHQSLPDRGKVRINEGDACHRTEKTRVDVVDLDPYGTAAPFIDGAVQCVNDGGKSNQMRCQSFYEQPLGRLVEKVHERTGNVNTLFKTQAGPPVPQKCTECGSALHVAGPMWSGPLHNNGFVTKVLEHLESNQDKYGTAVRMKGMLTVANEELHVPFYFTPSRIAGFFHSICPPLDDVASALLNAGHIVSRSHALPGSLKTSATREDVHDVFRTEANFTRHPRSITQASKVKLVRYQQNPAPNWGPGTKADTGTKRKREEENE